MCTTILPSFSSDEDDGSPVITRQGFQFLLLDTQAQVWHFILQYLDTVEQRGLDLVECLTFLFQLSFSTLGKVSYLLTCLSICVIMKCIFCNRTTVQKE